MSDDGSPSETDATLLRRLEESLWREGTRFDAAYLDRVLAADFVEFGRSGRRYDRAAILASPPGPIDAVLPLAAFRVGPIGDDVVLVTYVSERTWQGAVELTNRCSVWRRGGPEGFRLVFHQGTATTPELVPPR